MKKAKFGNAKDLVKKIQLGAKIKRRGRLKESKTYDG